MSISYQVIQQYFTAIEKGAGPQKQKIIQTLIMVNQHVPDLRKDQFKVLKGKNQRVQVRIDFGDKQTIPVPQYVMGGAEDNIDIQEKITRLMGVIALSKNLKNVISNDVAIIDLNRSLMVADDDE